MHPESDEGGDEPEITLGMIKAAVDQNRLDSGISMTADKRAARMLKAALTGKPDRALFDESIRGL